MQGNLPIALFDSDPVTAADMAGYLSRNGLPADLYDGAGPLLRRLEQTPPRLILLHWAAAASLPAVEVMLRVRGVSDVPCILRAREPDNATDRVAALEAGADDWISPEATMREVLARVRAVLRRAGQPAAPRDAAPPTDAPVVPASPRPQHWRLSPERRELYIPGGDACGLTSAEFDLLYALVRHRGAPVSRDVLSQAMFRRPWYPQDRGVDNVAARLRKKLAEHSCNPGVIKPVRSIGYVFTGF